MRRLCLGLEWISGIRLVKLKWFYINITLT